MKVPVHVAGLAVVMVAAVSACSTSGGNPGGGGTSLAGGVSGTCSLPWMYWSRAGDPGAGDGAPEFSTYQAAYQAEVAEFGSTNLGDDVPAQVPRFRLTAGGQTASIGSAVITFYDKGGAEITSENYTVNETMTAGQTITEDETSETLTQMGITGATSCRVATWTPGD